MRFGRLPRAARRPTRAPASGAPTQCSKSFASSRRTDGSSTAAASVSKSARARARSPRALAMSARARSGSWLASPALRPTATSAVSMARSSAPARRSVLATPGEVSGGEAALAGQRLAVEADERDHRHDVPRVVLDDAEQPARVARPQEVQVAGAHVSRRDVVDALEAEDVALEGDQPARARAAARALLVHAPRDVQEVEVRRLGRRRHAGHDEARAQERHVEALAVERHQHRRRGDPRAHALEHRSLLAERPDQELLEDERSRRPTRRGPTRKATVPVPPARPGRLRVEKERARRDRTPRAPGRARAGRGAPGSRRARRRPGRGRCDGPPRGAASRTCSGPRGVSLRDERELARVDRRRRERALRRRCARAPPACARAGRRAELARAAPAALPGRGPRIPARERRRGALRIARACCEGTRGAVLGPQTVHRFSAAQKRRLPAGRRPGARRPAASRRPLGARLFDARDAEAAPRARRDRRSRPARAHDSYTSRDLRASRWLRPPSAGSPRRAPCASRRPTRWRTARTTSSSERAPPVAARLRTSARSAKSAPPQYVESMSSRSSRLGGSPAPRRPRGISRTKCVQRSASVIQPARSRRIGS